MRQFCASWVVFHHPWSCFGLLVRGAKATSCGLHVAERKWADYSKSMIWVLQTGPRSKNNCFKNLAWAKEHSISSPEVDRRWDQISCFPLGIKKKKPTQDMCLVQEFVRDWSSKRTGQSSQVASKHMPPCGWDSGKEQISVNLNFFLKKKTWFKSKYHTNPFITASFWL